MAEGTFTPAEAEALSRPPRFEPILAVVPPEDMRHFADDPTVLAERCYNFYAGYGAAFRPRDILEIGVRRGYSAFALAHGAGTSLRRFVGLDFEQEGPALTEMARSLLQGLGVPVVDIRRADTQLGFPDIAGRFGLVHVDADHSFRGALTDLAIGLAVLEPGGVLVVDDDAYPPVAAAVDAAAAAQGRAIGILRIPNYRGHVLLRPAERPISGPLLFERIPPWARALLELEDLSLAARILVETPGDGALRPLAAVTTRALARLGDQAGLHLSPVAPSGALPAINALFGATTALVHALGRRPDAARFAGAESTIRGHAIYAAERLDGPDGPATRILLREFAGHAANFVAEVAPLALRPGPAAGGAGPLAGLRRRLAGALRSSGLLRAPVP